MTVVFDALGLAEDWQKAGLAPDQARRMAAALQNRLHEQLVTRADLDRAVGDLRVEIEKFRGEVRTEIEAFRGEVRADIQALRTEMQSLRGELRAEKHGHRAGLVMWMAGTMVAQAGVVTALVKLI